MALFFKKSEYTEKKHFVYYNEWQRESTVSQSITAGLNHRFLFSPCSISPKLFIFSLSLAKRACGFVENILSKGIMVISAWLCCSLLKWTPTGALVELLFLTVFKWSIIHFYELNHNPIIFSSSRHFVMCHYRIVMCPYRHRDSRTVSPGSSWTATIVLSGASYSISDL